MSVVPARSVFAENNSTRSFDYYIRDAVVYDGVALQGEKKDVGILGDKITFVGKLENFHAYETIQAKGLILAPGFIDAHTHSDFNPIVYPGLTNKVEQGVTTEVIGNCGMSAAPILGAHGRRIQTIWAREGVNIPAQLPWKTFEEYGEKLDRWGMRTNLVGLIGHGNLRSAVMGMDSRPASETEISEMKKMLRSAMREGAYGISFGLVYLPGIYAQRKEIIALCEEAGKHLGVCAFHMRSEGAQLLEAIEEVIDIGTITRSPIQISHLKAGGKANWGKIEQAFILIEQARIRGVKIAADAYPYNAGYAELGAILPSELYERKDRNAYFKNILKRKELLETLRKYDEEGTFRWESVMIASTHVEAYQRYEGMTLKQAALKSKTEPEKFLIDILADTNFEVSAFYFSQSDEVVQKVGRQSYVALGSDSIADGTRRPHPRAFGTFPKFIRTFVRENKEVSLGEAIRKMTSLPADHFGLENRGRIEEGYFADLVLFDAGKIKDKATYTKPVQTNQGIEWVFINGRPALREGAPVAEKYGRLLHNQWIVPERKKPV